MIVWQEPSEPNGMITGYEIMFSPGQTRILGQGNSFYLTTTMERNIGTQVRVSIIIESSVEVVAWDATKCR